MKEKVPLLIISDAITCQSGLARITCDLSTRVHEHLGDVYRIGTAGAGGTGSRKFPFPQYNLSLDGWICLSLPEIIEDFAGKERCKIMFIWDLHRLSWFSQPERLGQESLAKYPMLKQWLLKANIEKWCYVPLDSSGPNDRLSLPISITALGFDRLLAYGSFGESLLRRTIGDEEADKRHLTNLPHGIDSSVFYEHNRSMCRAFFLQNTGAQSIFHMIGKEQTTARIQDDETLISIVGTNQPRKNWVLGLETCAILSRSRKIRVWIHVNALEGGYSIPTLLADFGLLDRTVVSLGEITDNQMAMGYSASDLSLGIGPEGYGYCIAESMACGTPCITGSCANGPALVESGMVVDPVGFYYEGSFASKRPVYRAEDWAETANKWIGKRATMDRKYDWNQNWDGWEKWFREGAK